MSCELRKRRTGVMGSCYYKPVRRLGRLSARRVSLGRR